jgi:RHS repeat-associated protein
MNWQVLEERVAGVARIRNVWSVGYVDAMLLRDRDSDNNGSLEQRHYVQQDANWNVTSITSNTGAVQERYAYDIYGSRTVLSPTWVTLGGSAYAWNIGHQGGRFEILTGLIHKRGREYSPTLQTFVQRDLIFTSTNWYVAFGNNPVNYVDPNGLNPNQFGVKSPDEILSLVRRLEVGKTVTQTLQALRDEQLRPVDSGSNFFYVYVPQKKEYIDMYHFATMAQLTYEGGEKFHYRAAAPRAGAAICLGHAFELFQGCAWLCRKTAGYQSRNSGDLGGAASFYGREDLFSNEAGAHFYMVYLIKWGQVPDVTLSMILGKFFENIGAADGRKADPDFNKLPRTELNWQTENYQKFRK